MQRSAQGGGRFAFVGGRSAFLGSARTGGASPALALRNLDGLSAPKRSRANVNASPAPAHYSTSSSLSKEDREWFDWSKYSTTDSKYDPWYKHTTTDARFGMSDVWTQGMDPPQPIFPIDVKGRSKAYLPEVLSRKHNYIKYAMLNRPQQLHALNLATIRHLTPKWQAHKETTRAIVLTSSTPENFSSGSDFIELLQAVRSGNQDFPKTYFKELYQLIYYINSLDKPFLPIMNGITMGSGASLGYSSSSFRVTTEQAIFALPEVGMGFFPDSGATYFLPRLADHVGTFLALTGKRIRGWDVLWSGIASNLVPSDRLHVMYDQLDQLREKFHPFEQVIHCVQANEANKHEHPYLLKEKGYLDIIKRCFSQPTVPEIMKALSHEKNPWAKQVLERLKEQCPLSLAVTLRALQEGSTKDMGAALRREYRIALRFMLTRDFAEGVTARILERRKPNWSHTSVEDVHPDQVQAFFESLREDELDIRSLDEERAEDSAIHELLEKQRRFKKMARRPWIQDETRRYLAQELKAVQKELDAKQSPLKVGQLAAEETAARRAEYEKKLEERRTLKTDALSFLQQLEDELIRRRNVEKEAVNRMTVDKIEWARWEEDISKVREAKGILSLDVNTQYDEQLPTAALQTVLIDALSEGIEKEDLAKQVSAVAASLDTAGKSALELKAHLFRRSPEDVAELEANYERQYLAALEQEKVGRAVDEQINSLSLDEVKESMMQDYGLLSSEEREQLDILLSSTDFATEASRRKHQTKYNQAEQQQQQQKKQHQQQQQQDRPKVEMSADAPLTLDDIARLVLGGSDDAALVAETRAKIENRELAVSEEIYAAAVQLMRERALATTISSEERDIVEATFNTMREEITNVVKAKVAGQSREQMVNALLGGSKGQSQVKLANLLSQAAEGLSEEERVLLTNPENQALIFNEFRDFAKNVDSHISEGKVPLWKLDDQISAALAQRDLKTAWPDSKRSELAKQLANDRQLHDLHTFSSFNNKDGDNDDDDDNDDDEDTREPATQEMLEKLTKDAKYEFEHSTPAPIERNFMTEKQKDQFERNQSDMGLGYYGTQFEYGKLADKVAHFKRIEQRQAEFMAEVPDPISEPEQYRDWLVSLRMADLAAPALEEALGTWIEERAKAGYVVRPFPQELKEGGADGVTGLRAADPEENIAPTASIFKLWKMAKRSSYDDDDDNTSPAVPPTKSSPAQSSEELLRTIKQTSPAPSSSSSSTAPSSSSNPTQ